ncbi:MAG: hypothetical protein ABI806_08325 [Candidatus Solibacter sp.]
MSKRRPQNTGLSQARSAQQAGDEDACELLLAELRARRARLQELLSLVYREAAQTHARPAKQSAARSHSKRHPMVMKQIA